MASPEVQSAVQIFIKRANKKLAKEIDIACALGL